MCVHMCAFVCVCDIAIDAGDGHITINLMTIVGNRQGVARLSPDEEIYTST